MSLARAIHHARVFAGCTLAGFAVGVAAHLTGDAFRYGLGEYSLYMALFQGGIIGAIVACLTAVPTYYTVLEGRTTTLEVLVIALMTYAAATTLYIVAGFLTALFTPVAMFSAAAIMAVRRERKQS